LKDPVAEKQSPIETDAIVIGAGPVGLYQVFQLGLLGIKAHVIDALPQAGGQCVELYADKPIYDIPGIPFCTGQNLIDLLQEQIKVLKTPFHFNQEVTLVQKRADGRFDVQTSQATFISKVIIVSAGVGAFKPRKLSLPGIDTYEGKQVFYKFSQAKQYADQDVVINGGETAALEAAVALTGIAKSITLVHRRDVFKAEESLVQRFQDLCAESLIKVQLGQATNFKTNGERLSSLEVADFDGQVHDLPLDALLPLLGISPKLGPIADWGIDLENKQVLVDTEKFQSSTDGIFAVGDINTYPGKKKLIVCGFHEATLAAYGCAAHIYPGQAIHLQYTTTSPKLHEILGVKPQA
jgi:thioredoxin reductase (NADPH)